MSARDPDRPDSGSPNRSDPRPVITLGGPTFDDREAARVGQVLESGWVAGQGPVGAELEAAFARRMGTRHAVAVSNCTAALHLSLLALGVGAGDEVIVADYTFPATGHAVLFVGATPVFVDVCADTWTIDPQQTALAITPRTRGIIAVDAFGHCADYDELQAIADQHGLFLLEDAAAAAGARYRQRPAGSFGMAACFSLHGRKGITSGEGGLITTDDETLAATARSLSAFGMESAFSRQAQDRLAIPSFTRLGYNYKLSDIQAAIAVEQLLKLDELVARRSRVARQYGELLSGLEGVRLPHVSPHCETTWQSYVLTLSGLDRDRVALRLRAAGIQANIGTYASHLLPVYATERRCPVSASLFHHQLAIPMHANLSESDVERVAAELRRAIHEERERKQTS